MKPDLEFVTSGTVVQRYNGTAVQRYSGKVVQRYIGTAVQRSTASSDWKFLGVVKLSHKFHRFNTFSVLEAGYGANKTA